MSCRTDGVLLGLLPNLQVVPSPAFGSLALDHSDFLILREYFMN